MFCKLAAQVGRPILWVVDQANALDDGDYDRVSNMEKMQIRRLLDSLSKHMKLASSTQVRVTSDSRINLYLGLDDVSFLLRFNMILHVGLLTIP